MTLKPGVSLAGLQPQTVVGLMGAESAYRAAGLEIVITSVNDSAHGPKSLHYTGRAFDCRLPTRCAPLLGAPGPRLWDRDFDERVWRDLRERLGAGFDVILEAYGPQYSANRQNWHIHVEWDPK